MIGWHPGGHCWLVVGHGASARTIGFARWNEKPLTGLALGYVADSLAVLLTFGVILVIFRNLGACLLVGLPDDVAFRGGHSPVCRKQAH